MPERGVDSLSRRQVRHLWRTQEGAKPTNSKTIGYDDNSQSHAHQLGHDDTEKTASFIFICRRGHMHLRATSTVHRGMFLAESTSPHLTPVLPLTTCAQLCSLTLMAVFVRSPLGLNMKIPPDHGFLKLHAVYGQSVIQMKGNGRCQRSRLSIIHPSIHYPTHYILTQGHGGIILLYIPSLLLLPKLRCSMADLQNPDLLNQVRKKLDEWEKQFNQFVFEEYNSDMLARKQVYKENVKIVTALEQINVEREKKVAEISKLRSEFSEGGNLKSELIARIDHLREEQIKKKKALLAENENNKAALKKITKSIDLFKKVLALEIRRLHGEKLQIIFRNISRNDPDCPYTFVLQITEENKYKVTSCDPELEVMSQLESKLQETNNFSAFLANVRKQFVALSES
ncbi:SPC25 protein, partial [Polypterus senegalus]